MGYDEYKDEKSPPPFALECRDSDEKKKRKMRKMRERKREKREKREISTKRKFIRVYSNLLLFPVLLLCDNDDESSPNEDSDRNQDY